MGKYRRLVSRMAGSVDYWAQAAMRRFVLDIDRLIKAQDISRAELAEKLNTTPAYVTKVMRGDVNFTLETMTKLALAVGGKLQVRIVEADAISKVNRLVMHGGPKYHIAVWHSDRARQLTAAANNKHFEFNPEVATIEPTHEHGILGGRAA